MTLLMARTVNLIPPRRCRDLSHQKGFCIGRKGCDTYFQQGFRERNGNTKPYGKRRKVKNIGKIERKTGFDINGDGVIYGEDFDDLDPQFRSAQPVDDNIFLDPLA